MTLNLFPVNSSSEDSFVKDFPEKNAVSGFSGYGKLNSLDCWKDAAPVESVSTDIIERLPPDPFGMGIGATFTAITGWVEDFDPDEFNMFLNKTLKFQTETGSMEFCRRSNLSDTLDGNVDKLSIGLRQDGCALIPDADKSLSFNCEDMHVISHQCLQSRERIGSSRGVDEGASRDGFALITDANKLLSFNCEDMSASSHQSEQSGEGTGTCHGVDEGAPNDGLLFALGYLCVWDLLSTERVCNSLRSAIQTDVLLWRNIHIDQSLSMKITDDALLRLSNRAQGSLLCLSLSGCSRITDNGLKRVLECNPKLKKLNVAGCIGLSIDGIVNNLKDFKSSGTLGIKHLRIGGRYGVNHKHFEELKSLISADNCMQSKATKPRFYPYGHSSPSCEDDHAIDIEICPRCQNMRLVYDCPAESCQEKEPGAQICRACIICISRCVECGRCLNDSEYEETFCLDVLCLDCWQQLLSCQKGQEKGEDEYSSTVKILMRKLKNGLAGFWICVSDSGYAVHSIVAEYAVINASGGFLWNMLVWKVRLYGKVTSLAVRHGMMVFCHHLFNGCTGNWSEAQ
ncbi:hypothetical protein IFM89_005848 [Coptis chinensis]|uniref:F-box protein SKIP14 n=1 Tax=Coptis chinensis TaxID=261450 RepID=A0A835LPP7_9MAGN|nr:hypothetical protein IFM89_005848 [Coptis chinensis]